MSDRIKTNPFIEIPESILYPDEVMLPLNPAANSGYLINPVYFVTSFGRYFSIATRKLMEKKLLVNADGYYDIKVETSAGQKHLLAHRGMMATFYPRPDMYSLQVDHIDGDHQNNHISNLRWVTCQENNQYARQNGITPPRSRNISDSDIMTIMELAYMGKSDREIYEIVRNDIRVTEATIRFIRTGQMIYGEILQKLGIKPIKKKNHTYLDNKNYDQIAQLFKVGLRPSEIAHEMNIAESTVREHLLQTYGTIDERRYIGNLTRKEPKVTVTRKSDSNKKSEKVLDLGPDIIPINPRVRESFIINPWYYVSKDGKLITAAKGEPKEMLFYIDSNGFATVGLVTNYGTKQYRVHRIILSTFNPRPDMYELEIEHINGDKADNRLENLRWVTTEDKLQRAAAIGLISVKPTQRASDAEVTKVIELANKGYNDDEISEIFGGKYTPHNIAIIRTGDKSYGAVLERLGLQPFKRQQHHILTPEEKQSIKDYINSKREKFNTGLMALYEEAGEVFQLPSETIRKIYSS